MEEALATGAASLDTVESDGETNEEDEDAKEMAQKNLKFAHVRRNALKKYNKEQRVGREPKFRW